MTAVASVPRFASHPELVTYQCTVCLEVVTSPEKEDE